MDSRRRPCSTSHVLFLLGLAALFWPASSAQAAKGDCGQPSSTGSGPKSSDALFALRAAVGTGDCDLCVCDATGDGKVTSTDALRILRKAVGQGVVLGCPSCVPKLTGLVKLPAPPLSEIAVPSPTEPASLLGLTGLAPVAGASVELLQVDSEGEPILPALATTTSKPDGSYKFEPAPAASSTTIVRATHNGQVLRAFVSGLVVDLDPAGELVVDAALDAVQSDPSSDLGELRVEEIESLVTLVRQADVDFSTSATLAEALQVLDDATGGVYRSYVADFATGDGPAIAMSGNFHLVGLGMTFARSFVAASGETPSVQSRSVHIAATSDPLVVDAEGAVTQAATTGRNHTLVETSGSHPVSGAVNTSATLLHADVNQMPGAATGTLLAADRGRLLAGAQQRVTAGVFASGSHFALLPSSARANANAAAGGLGVLLRQATGLSNASLSATFWVVQLEFDLQAMTSPGLVRRRIEVLRLANTMTFDGNGNLSLAAAAGTSVRLTKDSPPPDQAAADTVVTLEESEVAEDAVSGLKYTLSSNGALTVKEGPDTVARGAVTPDGNILVLRFGDEDGTEASSGILIAVKRGSGMNDASGSGTYRSMDVSVRLESEIHPGTVDVTPSMNNRFVNVSGTVGTIHFDGAGHVGVDPSVSVSVGLNENSGVLSKSVPPDQVFDASTSIHSSTEGEGDGSETHTYAVASNGKVTVDAAEDGGITGYLSPDGKVFLLPIGDGDGNGLGTGVLMALRQP
jgi:hypothetical protein